MRLTKEEIKKLLPHREPMLLLDEVEEYEPGKRASAIFRTCEEHFYFKGHFPGKPIMPGVMQLEALAQAGAIAVLSCPGNEGKLALFGGAEKVKFRRQIVPGEIVKLDTQITTLTNRGGKGFGIASVNGEKCCEGEIMFILVSP